MPRGTAFFHTTGEKSGLVEATHGDLKFTAPLTGITAAIVGVILNLAVFLCLSCALAPGPRCDLRVVFRPDGPGPIRGALSL
jgi:hypothetical protein